MSRFISEALTATEPYFGQELHRLEKQRGLPNHDIRLSLEIQQASKAKIKELGLDPNDTTGEELYNTLQERMRSDDSRLVKTLRTLAATHVSAEADVVAGMVHALRATPLSSSCSVLKNSRFKQLIKLHPPKKAMKQLGYRSVESFLKHESPAQILSAAKICESESWHKSFIELYKKLKATDFEASDLTIAHPDSPKWKTLAQKMVEQTRQNVMSFPELGAIVILPLPKGLPAGATTASLVMALQELSDMRASNTYLKLSLMRPDFGHVALSVAKSRPELAESMFGRSLPWRTIQHYYSRLQHLFREELFEPHISLSDVSWPAIERILSQIEPTLEFWHESAALGVLFDHQPLSLNIVDAALNLCNQIPFEQRLVHYFQQSLWHELSVKYLAHETVESSVLTQLQPQFEYAAAK